MNTTVEEIPTMSIEEFAEREGLVMEIRERRVPIGSPARFYASFKSVEVKDGACLRVSCGNGATHAEAIQNYAREIELKPLVFDAMLETRRDFYAPRFVLRNDLADTRHE